MKVEKQIIARKAVDISIKDITLLSIEEFEQYRDNIPLLNVLWWLRSPGYDTYQVACIYGDAVYYHGDFVGHDDYVVRPAIVIQPNSNLSIGDKIEFAGYTWTMIAKNIAKNIALCDEGVGQTYFRKDFGASDANVYEKSDVEKWLRTWAQERGIEIETD